MKGLIFAVLLGTAFATVPRCTKPGLTTHVTDCRKYIQCTEDLRPVEKACPEGLEFNPTLEKCDWPRGFCTVQGKRPVEHVMSCHGLSDSAYYPDYADNCRSFYYCDKGVPKVGQCGDGKLFDKTTRQCTDEHEVKCQPFDDATKSLELDCSSKKPSSPLGNIEENCKSYYHCVNGATVKTYCEGSLIYSSATGKCEWPTNTKCNRDPPVIRGRSFAYDDDFPEGICSGVQSEHVIGPNRNRNCASYFVCRDDAVVEEFCGGQLVFNSDLGVCDFPENVKRCKLISNLDRILDCSGKHRTIHEHPTDCSTYLTCILGQPLLSRCLLGERFDAQQKRCIPDPERTCKATNRQIETVEALAAVHASKNDLEMGEQRIPNMANGCKSYFDCSKGTCQEEYCEAGLAFDYETDSCEPEDSVFCENAFPAGLIQARAYLPKCKLVGGDAWHPDEKDCTKFSVCNNGRKVQRQCHYGQRFDKKTLRCSPDNGVCMTKACGQTPHGRRVADSNDCRNYLECLNGELKENSCPQGMYYESSKEQCVINSGQCQVGQKTEFNCGVLTNGLFAPDDSNCVNFYVCINGDLKKMACPDGQYFHASNLQCTSDDGTCSKVVKAPVAAVKGNCGQHSNGARIKNTLDCTRYSICVNGEILPQKCPEGQYFSVNHGVCILNDGSCGSKQEVAKPAPSQAVGFNCDHVPNGQFETDKENCVKFFVCSNGNLMHMACPEGQYFSKSLVQCVDDDGSCKDVKGTFVAAEKASCGQYRNGESVKNPHDCQSYVICTNGEMISQKCPEGEYFNENTKTCLPDNGVCVPKEPNPTSCGNFADGEFVEDLANCVNFFSCVRGEMKKLSCSDGQYYNKDKQECVNDDGTCSDVIPTKPEKLQLSSTSCGTHRSGEAWPDEEDCQVFFICYNGETVRQTCDTGLYFDAVAKTCVASKARCACPPVPQLPTSCDCGNYTNGEFWVDDENCARFFVCVEGRIRSLSCPDGQFFSKKHRRCFPDDGTCEDVVPLPPETGCCDGSSNGKQIPDPEDCYKYYVCCNSEWVSQSCKDGLYFNATVGCCLPGSCNNVKPSDCGDIKDGQSVPGVDCKDYSVCRNGTLINETCQDGYYFNNGTLQCVVDNGECRTTTTTTTTETPGPLDCGDIKDGEVVPGEDCKDYSVCRNGTLINETCQDGYYFNNGTLECVVDNGECRTTTTTTTTEIPGPLDCGDIKDGEVVPGEDCKDYSVCRNGTLISETCQDGYYFNSETLECVVDNGVCRTTTTTTTTEIPGPLDCGDIKDGELVPGIDCKDYSVCVNGTLINEACVDGYYFNSETLQCVVDNGECRTTTTTTTTEIPGRDCGEIGNGQKAPHPDNCTLYLLCEDGELITHECENVIESETEVGVCICRPPVITPTPRPCGEHEDGSFSPDETDCTAFRLCCNGEFVTISCPEGYYYNRSLEICVSGQCTSQTTTTPVPELAKCGIYESGSFIANETDCEAYSICCDGRLINKTCPQGYHFDKDSGTCEEGLCKPLKCGEYEDGELIPSEDCQEYGICMNGTIMNQTCPDGYYFNSENRTCDVDNGECRTTTTTTTTEIPGDCEDGTPNGGIKPNPDNCTTYIICENSLLVIRSCEDYNETDPESGICKCPILPKPCGDVENGAFVPLVGDCAKFQMCCDGDLIVISCPEGTYFNSTVEICTPDNGECKGEPTTTTTTAPLENCGEYPSGSFVPLEDCKKYAICCDGKLINQTCPNGYYFNKDTSICTPDDGTCEKPTPQCTEGDLEGDRDSCFNYKECVGGKWVSKECEQGSYFNPSNKQCDVNYGQCVENCECDGLLNGEMGEDPGSCSRYKLCCNCKLLVLYCQYGYYFNSEAKDCVLDVNGTCPLPTLSPADPSCGNYPNGTFIQNLNDCRGYYLCLNGRTISGSCGDNEYFDTHEGTCKVGNCPTDVTEAPVTESVICSPECYGTYVADPTDCSNYYICYFSIPVRQTCPDGQYFDTANRVCSADRGQCKLTARDISPVCHGQHGTLVSHPTDCKRFYICVNGETIPYQCKSDEFFNDKTLKCETDSKGLCNPNDLLDKGQLVNCTGLSDGTLLRNFQDCSAFYVCSSGYPVPGQCPPGFSFENEELICVRDNGKCEKSQTDVSKMARSFPINLCEGQHGVLEADSKDCSKFYTCAYGKVLSHEKCNEGEYFDQLTRQCAKNTGHCISKLDMPSNLCSDKIEGAYIPDEKDCTKFLMCTRGYAIPQKCAKDMFFDPVHKYCRPNDGTCTKGLKEAKEGASGNLCYKKHGVFVAGDQCNRYELCINEQSVAKHQCKPGLYFDGKTGKCVTDDEGICNTKDIRARSAPLPNCHRLSSKIFYANAADKCHSFFKCESGAAHTYVCPKGLIFNTVLQQCDYPEFTECVDNAVPLEDVTCVGKLTGVRYVNVENGCQSYYLCVNGKDVEKSCPKGMLYNSKLDVCDWPQNVQCQGPYGKVQSRHGASAKKKGIDNSVCEGLELDKFYGNGADFCLTFFKCSGNTVHLFTCPPGLIFNSTTGACDYTHSTKCYDHKGQRVGNPPCKGDATGTLVENVQTRCQSFYICNNNEAVEQFCQDGMLFNAETKVCDWAYNVRCGVVQSHRSKRSASNEKPKHTPNCHNLKQNRYFGIAEDNCHSFFKCVGLHAMVQSCPPGLSFNSLKDECDWPHVGECFDSRGLAVRQPPCLGAETGTFVENLEDGCKSFFICNNNVAIEQRCQNGMLFNAEKNVCDWPQNVRCGISHAHRQKRHVKIEKPKILPSCSNVEENKLYGLKDDNCRTFFRCIDNQAFTYECPSGLIFNQLTNECDWPQTSECRNATKRVPPPPCVGVKDNTLVENLNTSCRSFFICEYSHPVEKFCQEGMLFNIKTLACDWPENVKCGAHLIHRERRDVDTPNCFNIKQNKFYGITKDGCQTFFKCLENKPFVYDCPSELIFNTEKGECDYPETTKCEGPEVDEIKEPVNPCLGKASGTFVVNFDNDCKSFFVCDNGKPLEKSCEDGMLFNAESQVCDWPEKVRCIESEHGRRQKRATAVGNPKILPSCRNLENNKFYGLASDNCRTFFKCEGSKASVYQCPSNLVFNSLKDECDWPEISHCQNVTKQPPPCVGVKDNTLVENLNTSCRSFYVCENNKPIERLCPDGMLFNIKLKACDWPQNVRCGAHLNLRKKREVDPPKCSEIKYIKQDKFYGITKDGCQTFFKCLDNEAFVYNCPPGLVFSTEKGECDYPEVTKCEGPEVDEVKEPVNPCLGKASGTFVVNFENDCKSFFVCDNDKPLEKFCNDGMLFNAESQVCDWPEKVRCVKSEHGLRQKRGISPSKAKILPSCRNLESNKFYGLATDNCRSFFRCEGSKAVVYECPSNLVFNSLKDECDWPEASQCRNVTKQPPPCVGVKDSTLVENLETSCRSYYICESDKPIERFCPDGMLFNIKTEACDWPENVRCGALLKHAKKEKVELPNCSRAKEDKFYGITNDGCQTFFKCLDNTPFVYNCPPGLVFSMKKGECDYPETTKCEGLEVGGTKESNDICLGKSAGVLLPNVENGCESFFSCDNNKATEKFCKKGMLFNAESQVCDWPEKVRCGEVAHGSRQKRGILLEKPKYMPNCFNVQQDKFYGISQDKCRSFFKCIGQQAFVYECPEGLIFNSYKDQCDWPEAGECFDPNGVAISQRPCMGTKSNTLIENLRTNCQSFFVCDNNKAIEQFCQNGMLFNAESQSCDWPQNVNCGFHWGHRRRRDVGANLPDCQKALENKFYGNTKDGCQTFFKCIEKKPFVYTCPAGLTFNIDKNQCDYPGVSKCAGPEVDEVKKPCFGRQTGDRIVNYDNGCKSFFICNHSKATEHFCSDGMLYNSKLEVCDWPENVKCVQEASTQKKPSFWHMRIVRELLGRIF